MAETGNYQLNQWEKTDRIQMEDFNADNAKIEAALAAEKQARENADAAQLSTLRSENLWVKIGETELSGAANLLSVPVENSLLYERLIVQFSTSGPKVLYLSINDGISATFFNNSYTSVSCTGQAELVRGYPSGAYGFCGSGMYDGENYWRSSINIYLRTISFEDLSAVGIRAGTDETLAAGTHVVVYGLKK